MAKDYLSSGDKMVLSIGLKSENYGWEYHEARRKVVLDNPDKLKGMGVMDYVSLFRGTGHSEWEFLLALWFIQEVGEALDQKKECELTRIFNMSLTERLPNGELHAFTREKLSEHLKRCFKVITDDQNELRIAA